MKVSEFLNRLATMEPAEKSAIVARIATESDPCERHIEKLRDWRAACEKLNSTPDDPETDNALAEAIGELSLWLATTPAQTAADLQAQIAWFEEDLGHYVKDSVSPAYAQIFDTLKIGAEVMGQKG